jgi:hypothetical protein
LYEATGLHAATGLYEATGLYAATGFVTISDNFQLISTCKPRVPK